MFDTKEIVVLGKVNLKQIKVVYELIFNISKPHFDLMKINIYTNISVYSGANDWIHERRADNPNN